MAESLTYQTPKKQGVPRPLDMHHAYALALASAFSLTVMFVLFITFRTLPIRLISILVIVGATALTCVGVLWVLSGAVLQIAKPTRPQWPVWKRLMAAMLLLLSNVPLAWVYGVVADPSDDPEWVTVTNGLETELVGTKIRYAGKEIVMRPIKPKETGKRKVWLESGPVDVVILREGKEQVIRVSDDSSLFVARDWGSTLEVYVNADGVRVEPHR